MPTPPIVTLMLVGAHPAFEAYVTENVKAVAVVPEPGLADPPLSVMVWDAPLQLAALAGTAVAAAISAPIATAASTWAARLGADMSP